jgi:hypothetical protein
MLQKNAVIYFAAEASNNAWYNNNAWYDVILSNGQNDMKVIPYTVFEKIVFVYVFR